jgi:hypothetical protein
MMGKTALLRWPGAFLTGALIGFVIVCVSVIAIGQGPNGPPRFGSEIRVRGADLSAAGGARVELKGEHGTRWSQVCRNGCDDVQLSLATDDLSFDVTVRDSQGGIIAGPVKAPATSGAGLTRWTVGGDAPLTIKVTEVERDAGGVISEKPHVPNAYDPGQTP